MKALEAKAANSAHFWSERQMDLPTVMRDFYYREVPRQFICKFTGSHPAVMAKRINAHPLTLDHDSPEWRTALTAKERRILIKSRLIDLTTDRFTGRGSYKLVAG